MRCSSFSTVEAMATKRWAWAGWNRSRWWRAKLSGLSHTSDRLSSKPRLFSVPATPLLSSLSLSLSVSLSPLDKQKIFFFFLKRSKGHGNKLAGMHKALWIWGSEDSQRKETSVSYENVLRKLGKTSAEKFPGKFTRNFFGQCCRSLLASDKGSFVWVSLRNIRHLL